MSSLNTLLQFFRDTSRTEREKGTYFEELSLLYFQHDAIQQQEYSQVWTYAEWAKEQGISQADEGIDLVAKLRDGSGICAIQCKFYAEDHEIQKSDIDSFFTASGKKPFTRRVIIDSTSKPYSKKAENALRGQTLETLRIGLYQLAESRIDWDSYFSTQKVKLTAKKSPFPHQVEALAAVQEAFYTRKETVDRGKLIMACGTGKTYTALHLVEELIAKQKDHGQVLFLVPSLALLQQTVTEWKNDSTSDFTAFAACSDSQIGVRKATQDIASIETHDLAFPACTQPEQIAEKIATHRTAGLTVIFSTYQSIEVLSLAQKKHGLPDFDLIICDEAHRTTGATAAGQDDDESAFVQVHKNEFIRASKRLYMTATPRIYSPLVKEKAAEHEATLYSMDKEEYYGKVLFHRGFAWAVENERLSDYKVLVLAVDEQVVSDTVQKRLNLGNNQLKLDDATKIIGCYKALTKQGVTEDLSHDSQPIKRALAFCKTIKSSQTFEAEFAPVVEEYLTATAELEPNAPILHPEVKHVDGTYKAKEREKLLSWLKAESDPDACRILSNAKCLSEGVDVPALDAILFLHPRKSQVDVVQSVGRVMRKSPGKKLGYVILPVVIPAGQSPEEALKKNEPYQVVWQVLNALRSHDERLDARINQASLGEDIRDAIEVVAVSHTLPGERKAGDGTDIGGGSAPDDQENGKATSTQSGALPMQSQFVFDEFSQGIMAKIVKKCGTRDYWEDWAKDIAQIAQKHITRITSIIAVEDSKQRTAFLAFLAELHDDLNDAITEDEAVEMLAQHLITKPVFDALFTDHNFTEKNPVSLAMQRVLETLQENNIDKEAESLQKFYDSVKRKAADIKTSKGRQELVVQLYDKFFRTAFKKMTERLGIVYTPVEVVDFIIHSVNDVLQDEFGQTLGSKGVHIIDPFTGTGTFITRLLQSGLIKPEELAHKYQHEIHANEIVLLAYYIAAINIEATYHELLGAENFTPFEGICLTDTFRMVKGNNDMLNQFFPINSERRQKQMDTDVRVIVGNPPYSAGQKSASDDAQNNSYEALDREISSTFVQNSSTRGGKRSIYDSYIRSLRWALSRLGSDGIAAFVIGSGFVHKSGLDGIRRTIEAECSKVLLYDLRGDVRKNMLSGGAAKEGENIFESESMTGITLVILIKKSSKEDCSVFYNSSPDNASVKEKKQLLTRAKTIFGVDLSKVPKNIHADWVEPRSSNFIQNWILGSKASDDEKVFFLVYSNGVVSNRDPWVFNFGKEKIATEFPKTIKFYNSECVRLEQTEEKQTAKSILNWVTKDDSLISWGGNSWKSPLLKAKRANYSDEHLRVSLFRPFQRMWHYGDTIFNHSFYSLRRLLPTTTSSNIFIAVSGVGSRAGFSSLITNQLPNLHTIDNGPCFPLYFYEKVEPDADELDLPSTAPDEEIIDGYRRKSAITDEILAVFKQHYGNQVSKEDIFYYVYGILHSPEYRERFSSDLKKMLPRIPLTKKRADYKAFTQAGRDLAHWHLNYETVEPYPDLIEVRKNPELDAIDPWVLYKVSDKKMKFGKATAAQKAEGLKHDKTIIHYNSHLSLTEIPLHAYEYVVNGKPALEWIIDRYHIKTDTKSGIINDPNDWCREHDNPRYIIDLLKTVCHVSTQTNAIVATLPALNEITPEG